MLCKMCLDTGEVRKKYAHIVDDRGGFCECANGRKMYAHSLALDRQIMPITSDMMLDIADAKHEKAMEDAGAHRCLGSFGYYCHVYLDEPGRCADCAKVMKLGDADDIEEAQAE